MASLHPIRWLVTGPRSWVASAGILIIGATITTIGATAPATCAGVLMAEVATLEVGVGGSNHWRDCPIPEVQ